MSCFSCVLSGFEAQKPSPSSFPNVSERFWYSESTQNIFEISEKTIFETTDLDVWELGRLFYYRDSYRDYRERFRIIEITEIIEDYPDFSDIVVMVLG